jgi:hypothetical protein
MTEPYLTMTEIEDKYRDEWVLIADARFDKYDRLVGGHVELHHADGVEFHMRLREWDKANPRVKSIATIYLGRYPAEEVLTAESEPGAA